MLSTWPGSANQPVAYGLLLAATACLGAGFGLTVAAINELTAAFHPYRVARRGVSNAVAPAPTS